MLILYVPRKNVEHAKHSLAITIMPVCRAICVFKITHRPMFKQLHLGKYTGDHSQIFTGCRPHPLNVISYANSILVVGTRWSVLADSVTISITLTLSILVMLPNLKFYLFLYIMMLNFNVS